MGNILRTSTKREILKIKAEMNKLSNRKQNTKYMYPMTISIHLKIVSKMYLLPVVVPLSYC